MRGDLINPKMNCLLLFCYMDIVSNYPLNLYLYTHILVHLWPNQICSSGVSRKPITGQSIGNRWLWHAHILRMEYRYPILNVRYHINTPPPGLRNYQGRGHGRLIKARGQGGLETGSTGHDRSPALMNTAPMVACTSIPGPWDLRATDITSEAPFWHKNLACRHQHLSKQEQRPNPL